jgi:DNA-binding NtrC family response regulator
MSSHEISMSILHGQVPLRYRAPVQPSTSYATTEDKPVVIDRRAAPIFRLCAVYSGKDVLIPPEIYTPRHGATRIGRGLEDGISLPRDPRVSRIHATLHKDPAGKIHIVDEGSRNGMLVNGCHKSKAQLDDGDVIGIGDSYLVVRVMPPELPDAPVPALVGVSPTTRAARAALFEAGPTTATVLLLAESGCGKEVAARALHDISQRSGPLVTVNCSAIPESLAESQFFGQVIGAFTGASSRPGLFRAAHRGTLFLDEIGDLPWAIQPKLLRVLEERAVLPVGGTESVPVDVRVIAATNQDIGAGTASQQFRGDLYARLAQLEVRLSPLRDRREDVLLLLAHALGAAAPRLTPRLAEALLLHDWPFNVREAFSVAQQLQIRAAGGELFDLPLVADRLGPSAARGNLKRNPSVASASTALPTQAGEANSDEARDPVPSRADLEAMLEAHDGVVAAVARMMRRSRKQVYRWISSYGLDVRQYRREGR